MSTAAGTDLDQVVAASTDYLAAFYEDSAEERAARMRRVLHPHLAKRTPCPSYQQDDGMFRQWLPDEVIQIAFDSADYDGSDGEPLPYSLRLELCLCG